MKISTLEALKIIGDGGLVKADRRLVWVDREPQRVSSGCIWLEDGTLFSEEPFETLGNESWETGGHGFGWAFCEAIDRRNVTRHKWATGDYLLCSSDVDGEVAFSRIVPTEKAWDHLALEPEDYNANDWRRTRRSS
jgi:hypothetical protein